MARLYVGASDVEAPRAFRRPVIDRIGGWNESLTACEDWDLAERADSAGIVVGRVDAWIWHDEGRIRLRATFAKKRYYGHWVDRYVRAGTGRGQRRFMRTALLRQPARLLHHPVLTAGLVGLKSVEATGLLLGVRDARRGRPAAGVLP